MVTSKAQFICPALEIFQSKINHTLDFAGYVLSRSPAPPKEPSSGRKSIFGQTDPTMGLPGDQGRWSPVDAHLDASLPELQTHWGSYHHSAIFGVTQHGHS